MKQLSIAIDGPAGAGKSTVARILSHRLRYIYIDTGAMYRAVTWQVLENGVSVSNTDAVASVAENTAISLTEQDGRQIVTADGRDITEAIRTPAVTRAVARVASQPAVRRAMLLRQRQMALEGGVVMDGRDIGSHVLPSADLKIFLTASIEERARRRWNEMTAKGHIVDFTALQEEIAARDKADCERDVAPLIQADDAVLIDTTELSIEGAVEEILRLCRERDSGV